MKKLLSGLLFLSFFIITSGVSAHVTIDPKEAMVGRQAYYLKVPNEKDIPTTQVKLLIPEGVEITGILPVFGWTHTELMETAEHQQESSANGDDDHDEEVAKRITQITWSGGKINPGEYILFGFSTNYTGQAKSLNWKAYQTYLDGEVVAWDDANEKSPAPKVTVLQEAKSDSMVPDISNSTNKEVITEWLAGGAFLLSILALLISLKGKKIIM